MYPEIESQDHLDATLLQYGLTAPIPDRHESPSDGVVDDYIKTGPIVMNSLREDPLAASFYASGVREHVTTKNRSQWNAALETFRKSPDALTKSQVAYWLRQLCGGKKDLVEDLVEFCEQQDPSDLRELLSFLTPRINQQQWDRLAPKMTLPKDKIMLENIVTRRASTLEKNGVTPWFPEVEDH